MLPHQPTDSPTREASMVGRISDWISRWLIYGMAIFSPWAFGTTQAWSIQVMNWAGYALGILLAVKIVERQLSQTERPTSNVQRPTDETAERRMRRDAGKNWQTPALFALTILILLYCAVAAWNARATYSYIDDRFAYHEHIAWLPHSYDSIRSWSIFWNYLAMACAFWAIRDWMQNEPEISSREKNPLFSRRWKKLLWVISINGALLALEGLLQRTDNTGKLLWLVEPNIHKDAASQFGPYAYRSNGAQFLNLIWPISIGFWWSLQRSAARGNRKRTAHHLLLPAAIIMAAGAIISLSRGGILVAVGCIFLSLLTLLIAGRRSAWKIKFTMLTTGVATTSLAAYVNWSQLIERFKTAGDDQLGGRERIFQIAKKMIRDYPVFGTGPNTFDPVSQLYLGSPDAPWIVQVHNDWLETLATFGWVGSSMIWLALLLVLTRPFFSFDGIRGHWVLIVFIWIALGGCLAHAAFDFPFQIYSILFLFLVFCAVLSSTTIRRTG